MTALLAAGSVLLAGCQNEEDPMAKAVLASASSLSFAAALLTASPVNAVCLEAVDVPLSGVRSVSGGSTTKA